VAPTNQICMGTARCMINNVQAATADVTPKMWHALFNAVDMFVDTPITCLPPHLCMKCTVSSGALMARASWWKSAGGM
jgi:hypothetical protein